jgi:hypothetical protein
MMLTVMAVEGFETQTSRTRAIPEEGGNSVTQSPAPPHTTLKLAV